jgi:arylsulfatase A
MASDAIVATYDLFPTVLSLAGVPLATDRIFDGIDISPVLFGTSDTAHECIMHVTNHPSSSSSCAFLLLRQPLFFGLPWF